MSEEEGMMSLLAELDARGLVAQYSDRDALKEALKKDILLYLGIDPTAPSLHVGHLLPIILCLHFARAGHRPIMLLGGGTTRIGDPSGKTESRPLMDQEGIEKNCLRIQQQIESLFRNNIDQIDIVNNAEWLNSLNYIDFLRDIGKHFSVNRMLSFETYKQRLQGSGLSFIEFNYQLLQSYDFLTLFQQKDCYLQVGGDDQWGNIVSGIDLVRRICGKTVFGLTCPLLTTADGTKMGKSEKGAIFLDSELCSSYDFFQYWRNIDDRDVMRFLKFYTMLPLEEIDAIKDVNQAKEQLAYEVTSLVHGVDRAKKERAAAQAIFSGGNAEEHMPKHQMPLSVFEKGIAATDLFVEVKLCKTKSDVRRLIRQGGAQINYKRLEDEQLILTLESLDSGRLILRSGKKSYCLVETS